MSIDLYPSRYTTPSFLNEPKYISLQDHVNQRGDGCGIIPYIIAGFLVIWVFVNFSKPSFEPRPLPEHYRYMNYPMEMIQTSARVVKRAISGRLTTTYTRLLKPKECGGLNIATDHENVVVADTKDGSWKDLPDGEKQQIDDSVRKYLNQNDDVFVMVFAPWCPHCHSTIPKLLEVAQKSKDKKFLIVNAETMKRSTFTEGAPDALFPIKYFPTMLNVNKGKCTETELESIVEEVKPDDPVPEKEDSDMLAALF